MQDDINSLSVDYGMPVNQRAFDIIIEKAMKDHAGPSEEKDAEVFNKAMKEISNQIDYLYDMDYLKQDIMKPIQAYMDDEMTLDEAIKKAEENVMIRLNE